MNLLEILKKIEPNISQIARDAGLRRQSVYSWGRGSLPRYNLFKELIAMSKYRHELSKLNYNELREEIKLGRPIGSVIKKHM